MYNLSRIGRVTEGGNRLKRFVAGAALAAALLVAGTAAHAEDCRVCVKQCRQGYVVYYYDLDGNSHVVHNSCIQ